MSIFYSAKTGGFYDTVIHRDLFVNAKRVGLVPDPKGPIADAVAIADDEHRALLEGQGKGKCIGADDNGRPVLLDPPPPTPEQQKAALTSAVQRHLDTTAQAAGYDDIKSAVTYAEEPAVPTFQNEGRAFRAWRSRVWEHCVQVLTDVEAGTRDAPSAEDLIAELPPLDLGAAA